MRRRYEWPLLSAVLLLTPGSAMAEVRQVNPGDDLRAAMNALEPGDELVLAGGTYTLGGRLGVEVAGTAAAPIVIRAADGESPHVHRPNASENIIDFDQAEYLVLRGIEFSGGSAGVRFGPSRFVTIESCEIHDTGDVALRMNNSGAVYESMQILRNHIHHTNNTGEGMYLGCNDDACRLQNSLIEGNYIHHLDQPSVDQGDGIEIKEGSSGNIVRDNVIHDTRYPCILTYSAVGNGPPNIIERNVMWNCGDHAIQIAADGIVRNNIILSAAVDGIAMQSHQAGAPSNLTVVHNTILKATNDAISLRNTVGPVTLANNAVYAQNGRAIFVGATGPSLTVAGNVGVGGLEGASGGYAPGNLMADLASGHYSGAPPVDVFPRMGGALIGAGDGTFVPDDDFNGEPRSGTADVGAYAFASGGNPGWDIAPSFKGIDPGPPPARGDAGAGSPDGGVGASGDGGGGNPAFPITADPDADRSLDGGCTVGPGPKKQTGWWLLVICFGFALSRRRRAS